ncbi:uncharacterized protein LOC144654596 isoform X6 [Oculina patagonica]
MKTELVLMLLCFLLASLAVLGRPADETDVEDKNEDHVKALEDARWGRKPYGRKSGRRKRPEKDQRFISDWPWNKRTATDLDKDQKFFDWPWNKRTATDVDEDWPWNKRTANDLDKDQKFFDWPWNKRTATDVDKDWPWNKRTATDLDKGRPADETDVEDKNEDHVKVLEDPRWDAPPNPDWPWNKRTATDLDKGRPADETDVEDKNEDHVKVLEHPRWGRKTHGRKSSRRNRSAQDAPPNPDWPWNKRTATDLDKGRPADETDVEDKNEDHVKVLEDPRWDAPPNPDWPWNKRTATDLDKGRPADETDVEDKNEDHVKVLEDPRWGK